MALKFALYGIHIEFITFVENISFYQESKKKKLVRANNQRKWFPFEQVNGGENSV